VPSIVEIDIAVGLAAVLAIALMPLVPDSRRPQVSVGVAVLLIALPLPTAVLLQPQLPGSVAVQQSVLFAALLAFVAGAFLLRVSDDDGGGGGPPGGGDPPWWPDFEDAFRRYERSLRTPSPR
jgi:hypothetical protein